METARTKLNGPAKNWFNGRQFVSWKSFEEQFKLSFIGPEVSTVERMKCMMARVQQKNESLVEYFHEKINLRRDLNLSFQEIRQQVIEGLYARELCYYLLSRNHTSEDQLLSDILVFTKINESRGNRFKSNHVFDTVQRPKSSQNTQSTRPKTTISTVENPVHPSMSSVRCFNCGSYGHLSTSCMQPKRTPGACFKCGSSDHQRNSCPQNRPRPPGNRNHFGPSNAAMVLQTTGPVTPAYIVPLLFKFPSGDSTQISAVIDTGSPVSLIKQALIPIVTEISEPTVSSGIVGINGSELVILGDVFVDITPLDSQFPINVKLNVVPDTTIKCDCLLGRNFLSHPNVIFNIDNGNFEIEFKRPDIVPFNEILSLEIVSEQTELDIDIEMTLPHNVKTDVRNIFYKNYLSDNNCDHKLNYNAVIPSSEIEIELKDSNVFYFNPRRLSYYEKNEL